VFEVFETSAVDQDFVDAAPGEPRPVLDFREKIGKLAVRLFERYGLRIGELGRLDFSLADPDFRLAPLEASRGDRSGVL